MFYACVSNVQVFDDLKKYDAVGYTSDIMCMDCVWPTFPSGKDSADIFKVSSLQPIQSLTVL